MESPFDESLVPREIVSRTLQVEGVVGAGGFAVVLQALENPAYSGRLADLSCSGPICISISEPATSSVRSVRRFAVKALLRTSDHRTRLLQENEVRLHNRASGHPSILTLYHVVDEGLFTYMVMELCPYGDLFRVIESEFFSNNVRAIKSTYGQLLDAVVHCHSLGIYHRDIKPENILVKCYEDECPKIVLADFGLATEDLKDSGAIGSELYMSPECLGLYGKAMPDYACAANDVWSMGVILSLLIFGPNVPWSMASDQCEHFAAYCNNIDWYFIEYFNVTVEANHLLTATFRLNPYQRITINALQADFHLVDQFTTALDHQPVTKAKVYATGAENAATIESFDPFCLRDSIAESLNITYGPNVSPDCDLPEFTYVNAQQEECEPSAEPLRIIPIRSPSPERDLITFEDNETPIPDEEIANVCEGLDNEEPAPPQYGAVPEDTLYPPMIVIDSEDSLSDAEAPQRMLGRYIIQQREQMRRSTRRIFSGHQPSPLRQCVSVFSVESSSSFSSFEDFEADYPGSGSSSITSTSSGSDDLGMPLTPPTIIIEDVVQMMDEVPRSSVMEEVTRKLQDLQFGMNAMTGTTAAEEESSRLSVPTVDLGHPLARCPPRIIETGIKTLEPTRIRDIQEWINERQNELGFRRR